MKRRLIFLGVSIAFVSLMFAPAVMAKQKCQYKKHDKHSMPKLSDKVMHKAHFILKNAKEIGLSEEQIKTVKKLKMEAKKIKIRKKADANIIYIDVLSELHNEPVNVEKASQLIDQKYEVKKVLAREMIAKYAEIKSVLTPEQYSKLKEIWWSSKK